VECAAAREANIRIGVHPVEPDVYEDDDIEIVEVVGLDEDSPGASPVRADTTDEVVIRLEQDPADTLPRGYSGMPEGSAERLRRMQADFENYKKRVARERKDQEHHATAELIGRLLPVLDNFERALSVGPGMQNEESLRGGVILIFRQILDELRKEGLSAIESVGQPFDPRLHDAVQTAEGSGHPPNTVIDEIQRGYRFRSRLLRPALVRVSVDAAEMQRGSKPDGGG